MDDPANSKEDEEDAAPNYQYYKSEKILGKLYREVDEKKVWSSIQRSASADGPSIWDQLLGVVDKELRDLRLYFAINWESQVETALTLKEG